MNNLTKFKVIDTGKVLRDVFPISNFIILKKQQIHYIYM